MTLAHLITAGIAYVQAHKEIQLPVAALTVVAVYFAARVLVRVARYLRADAEVRPMMRRAWRIKRRWQRDARRVALIQIERGRPRWWSPTPSTTVIDRERFPQVTVRAQRWGVSVDAATFGRLGLREFQDQQLGQDRDEQCDGAGDGRLGATEQRGE